MYAIAFDMIISDLEEYYGKPYNNAYYEISNMLQEFGFYRAQGSVYLAPTQIWLILWKLFKHFRMLNGLLIR